MDLIKKEYADKAVEACVTSFHVETGVTEYQVLLTIKEPTMPFVEQLRNIQQVYQEVVTEELPGDAVAVFRRYFLSDAANQLDGVMSWECENAFCALSVVQQAPLNGTKVAMWTYLQTGMVAERAERGLWKVSHGSYGHYWLGGAFNKAINSEYQTRLLMNDYVMSLLEEGCKLSENCLRTWLFVQNVDVNYAGVVKARREAFITQGLTEKTHYIASTGIGGRHADPEVLVQMDAYAVKGLREGQVRYLYAPTHLNPTYEYGVTFERGVAIEYGDRKHIFISGTASINNRGEIVHPGDVISQAGRMMENIETLLAEAGAGLEDIVQSVTYLRDPADYHVVREFMETRYPWMSNLIVLAPVCRPGWLIETECIAMVEASGNDFAPL